MFDNNIVFRVQQANDIVDVIGEHISLTKKGREMVGLCPFHEDHRPSMYVNGVKQILQNIFFTDHDITKLIPMIHAHLRAKVIGFPVNNIIPSILLKDQVHKTF